MRELFDQLRAEADRRILPEPAQLRVRSDRRAARRMATGVLAIVLALTGGIYATWPEPRATFEIATSAPPSIAGPMPITTVFACGDGFARQIPVATFVPGGLELCFDQTDPLFFVESIPTPCRPAARPTDALIQDRRGFENTIPSDKAGAGQTVIHQVVTRYNAQGATQFVSELSRDVGRCPPYSSAEVRLSYSVVSSDSTSVRLNAKYELLRQSDSLPPVSNRAVLVKRIGSYVAVVYDHGWEGLPSDETTLTTFYQTLVANVPTT